MKLNKLAGIISLLCASSALAVEPFTITDIRVEGIQRTEAGTVFGYLPVKVGDTLDDSQASAAIRALYATGFYKDVRLAVKDNVLIVSVRERPSIASIKINGVKEFPEERLQESLKYSGLAEARIFDKGVLEKATQELKRQYVARGKYGVSVKTKVSELERNRVAVTFDVVEGDTAEIKQINLIGSHDFSEEELRDLMKLSTPGWMSWFSKNDQYSKQKLSADLETIRSFYMDNGYLEFNIDSTQISITPDKQDIYITINLTEGTKYTVSKVEVSGDTLVPKEELEALVQLKVGDPFSRKSTTETTAKMGERLGQDGYAFANVNAIPTIDKEKSEAEFNFLVDPGKRVYIRHINIAGNDRTRDEVIRREFRQVESAWFNVNKIKKSKQRVDRLNFFSEVNVETPSVAGTADQIDVNVAVKEKSTGSITLGAGFSNGEGFTLSGGITQANLFGSGNAVSVQVNTSKVNQVYALSYTNPYFTDDGVSRGFDIYKRDTNSSSTTVTQFSNRTFGGGVRFGVPIQEDQAISYGLAVENSTIGLDATAPLRLTNYVTRFGATTTNLTGTVGWSRDTRDSAIYTTSGTTQQAVLELALPVFDMRYYKLNYKHQYFRPLSDEVTLFLNGEVGVAGGYSNKELPFFKNFYAGGPGSVRGYEFSSLGPRDSTNAVLGGTRRMVATAELLVPFPGSNDNALRLSGFVDAGGVYGPGDLPGSEGLRYSAGVAFTWVSPVGPMKFSYGVPLNQQKVDKVQQFQFTLGSIF